MMVLVRSQSCEPIVSVNVSLKNEEAWRGKRAEPLHRFPSTKDDLRIQTTKKHLVGCPP